jgi:SAM-dependent methyltransferase
MEPMLSTPDDWPLTAGAARARLRGGPLRLFVGGGAVAPVRVGDIVEVTAGAGRRGDLALVESVGHLRLVRVRSRHGDGLHIDAGDGRGQVVPDTAEIGVVRRVEQTDRVLHLDARRWRGLGRLAAARPRLGARALGVLAGLERLRRPLYPPVFLGTPAALDRQVARAYEAEAACWSGLTGLRPEEETLVARSIRPGTRVLDVGCGGGREAIAFARAGAVVHAIDPAPALVAAARREAEREGLGISFEVACATGLAPGAFDLVYVAPGTYAHVAGRQRRVALLAALGRCLVAGGRLAVAADVAPPPGRLSRARLVDLVRALAGAIGLRASEPGDRYTRGHALVPPPNSWRYVHHFSSRAEIAGELRDAGLAVEAVIDDRLWLTTPVRSPRETAGG